MLFSFFLSFLGVGVGGWGGVGGGGCRRSICHVVPCLGLIIIIILFGGGGGLYYLRTVQ